MPRTTAARRRIPLRGVVLLGLVAILAGCGTNEGIAAPPLTCAARVEEFRDHAADTPGVDGSAVEVVRDVLGAELLPEDEVVPRATSGGSGRAGCGRGRDRQ
jgi:hypothetical protein